MIAFGKQVVPVAAFATPWLWVVLVAQDPPKTEANNPKVVEQLRGDYVLRAGTVNGTKMTADRIANVSMKITDKTITTYDGQREQRFGAGYRILTEDQPWSVTLKSVKKPAADDSKTKEKIDVSEGIIELADEGKRLRLAYAVDSGQRPKDFKGGKLINVFEFERLKSP